LRPPGASRDFAHRSSAKPKAGSSLRNPKPRGTHAPLGFGRQPALVLTLNHAGVKAGITAKSGLPAPDALGHVCTRHVQTTPAILLRKTRFSETSLIVTWFTHDLGRLKTVVKGALRPKNRFAGMLDLFFDCEISIAHSVKSELHTLREVVLRDAREGLRKDYRRVALASYFVELIELTTEPEHPAPELYDLLFRAFAFLDQNPPSARALLHFESELARMLGIANPDQTAIVAIGRVYHRIPTSRAVCLAKE